jgi:hypothetical protein
MCQLQAPAAGPGPATHKPQQCTEAVKDVADRIGRGPPGPSDCLRASH